MAVGVAATAAVVLVVADSMAGVVFAAAVSVAVVLEEPAPSIQRPSEAASRDRLRSAAVDSITAASTDAVSIMTGAGDGYLWEASGCMPTTATITMIIRTTPMT